MKKESQKISAVYDKDIERVLRDLGLFENVMAGRIKCVFCGEIITLSNLEFIFSKNKQIVISCNKDSCKYKMKENIPRQS